MEEERDEYVKELMNGGQVSNTKFGASGSVVGKVGEISEEEKKKKRQGKIRSLIIGGVVGIVFLLVGLLLSVLFSNREEELDDGLFAREETKVAIFVAPMSAEVKIDGEVYSNGIYEFSPGEYTAEITATGYVPRAYSFKVESDRVTLLYDYLEKKSGEKMTDREIDLMRYLANDDKTIKEIESFLLTAPEGYAFLSSIDSPIRNYEFLLDYYGDSLSDYSYRLIRETLDAYFYFARSGTKNVYLEKDSLEEIEFSENKYFTKVEFRVLADRDDEYRVSLEITRSQAEPDSAYRVWRVTILSEAGTALFQYDGKFTMDDSEFTEYDDSLIFSNGELSFE